MLLFLFVGSGSKSRGRHSSQLLQAILTFELLSTMKHDTCALCRQPNMDEPVQEKPPVNPTEVPNLKNVSNEEIVARLERLLHVNELRRELNQVSEFFDTREELAVESILQLCVPILQRHTSR